MNDMIFYDDLIQIDPTICLDLNPKTLVDSVYPNLNTNYKDVKFMLERLAPTNEDVDYMNAFITNIFPGEVKWPLPRAKIMKKRPAN